MLILGALRLLRLSRLEGHGGIALLERTGRAESLHDHVFELRYLGVAPVID